MTDTKTKDRDAKTPAEVVPTVPDETGELVPMTKELVKRWLEGAELGEAMDENLIDLDEAIRILSAETPAEALRKAEMRNVNDYDGKAFVVLSVAWRKSTRSDSGKGRYAVMRCVDADGAEFLTTCGATKVVLQLRRAQLAGWFPWQVQLEVTKTESGNTVKELVAPGEPF